MSDDSEEQAAAVGLFMALLQLPRADATVLAAAGLTSIEEVAYVPWQELRDDVALAEDVLQLVRDRARRMLLGGAFDTL